MGKMTVIGVVGGSGGLSAQTLEAAERLGELIAGKGWVLLNGGRNTGVMEHSARGAKRRGGLTVGILPNSEHGASEHIDIPVYTGMGDARNVINVLSSDVVIACPGHEGTLSEVALALKNGKPVIFLGFDHRGWFERWAHTGRAVEAATPEEAIQKAEAFLRTQSV